MADPDEEARPGLRPFVRWASFPLFDGASPSLDAAGPGRAGRGTTGLKAGAQAAVGRSLPGDDEVTFPDAPLHSAVKRLLHTHTYTHYICI